MSSSTHVKNSLEELAKKWPIDPHVYDLHLGRRDDVVDTPITVGRVIFHIPTLARDNLYVLWKCLWPDCHNCCERQGRLPLTKDDIGTISQEMGYATESEFLRNETRVSSWQEEGTLGNLITDLTMISLKRKTDERDEEDGKPVKCRFLDEQGSCKIHPDKPGVCWLYPFASWLTSDQSGSPVAHATFQFTGDCPGFYTSTSLDGIMPVLQSYSDRIYDYNLAVVRTSRENYGAINFVSLEP